MAKYSINDTTLTNIANPLRKLRGLTDGMTPEEMAVNAGAVQTNVTGALAKIAEKGVSVPDGANSDHLPELIAAIETGGGGTAEICTVTFSGGNLNAVVGTVMLDGVATIAPAVQPKTVEFVKNTLLVVVLSSGRYSAAVTGGAELVHISGTVYFYNLTGDATITVS